MSTDTQEDPQPPLPTHWEQILSREFEKESDRASVIVALALLDSALETLLRTRLVPSPHSGDTLLEGAYAPISTFSARVDLAFRIGLISSRFARDLHLIRKIRNDFAHNITGCTFEDSAVKSRVLELVRSHRHVFDNEELRKRRSNNTKGEFQLSVSWMQWCLRALTARIEALESASPEFGYHEFSRDSEEK